jgi:uncharacterized protein
MKYLLLLLVLLAGVWLWRSRRVQDRPPPPAAPPPPARPDLMVTCRHCGVHLPASDAISDARGHYCSIEHLRLERERPPLSRNDD